MPARFVFPPFVLDSDRHVVVRDGVDLPLSPHLVDILQHLVASRGALVSKNDLLERFWPDVHVSENTLTRAIADIRKALDDDSRAPRYIQTVARRGYRFLAAVDSDCHAATTPQRANAAATRSRR